MNTGAPYRKDLTPPTKGIPWDHERMVPRYVRPSRGDVKVNQHAAVFLDKRTKRNRDRSSKTRRAIKESADE